ncbi:hypothetical protein [Nostoc sp.]
MSRQPLLDQNRSYTFSNYFELGFAVDDLVLNLAGNVWQFGKL